MTSTIKWNPGFPKQIGQEHNQPGYGSYAVNAGPDTTVAAFTFEATETATPDTFSAFAHLIRGRNLGDRYGNLNSPMMVEVYEAGDPASFQYSISEYPAAIITGNSVWNDDLTPGSVDRIENAGDGKYMVAQFNNTSYVSVQFGGGLDSFPLDRVPMIIQPEVRVNAGFRIQRHDPGQPAQYHWYVDVPALNPSGYTHFYISQGELKADWGDTEWTPWTAEDARMFGGTTRERAFTVRCIAGGGVFWKLDQVKLRIFWSQTPRIAYGATELSNDSYTWVDFPLIDPSTGSAPTFTQGQRYTVIVRRIWDYHEANIGSSAQLNMRYMNTAETYADWEPRKITNFMRPTGRSDVAATDLGMYSAYFSDGGVATEMTQPYNLNRGLVVQDNVDVFMEQTVTVTGAATSEVYGQVFAQVGWRASRKPSSSSVLRCEVFNDDGDRVLGAQDVPMYDIERIPLDNTLSSDQGTQFRQVQFLFSEGAILPAGTYTIRISAPTALADGTEFEIYSLTGNPSSTETRSFGSGDIVDGGTDYATGYIYAGSPAALVPVGPPEDERYGDAAVLLATVPPAPENLSSSHGVITTHKTNICPSCNKQRQPDGKECTGCGEHGLPFGHISWDALDAADATHYEVGRMDDLSPDWEIVARVYAPQTYWSDYEARVGVQSQYRVRGVNAEGIPGLWSDPTSVTLGGFGGDPGMALMFSSNGAVQMSCVYPEVFGDGEVERRFDFLEADDVVFGRIYGRERQVAFRPIERTGMQFSRTLLLNAVCTVSHPTMDVFSPIRDLSWASIPYVCVRDGEGNRWYANIQVTRGINRRPGEMWYVTIEITEVADGSTIYDSTTPQVESAPGGPA